MSHAEDFFSSESLHAYVVRGIERAFYTRDLMKERYGHVPDKEKCAREYTRLVHPPRPQPVSKEKGRGDKQKKAGFLRM